MILPSHDFMDDVVRAAEAAQESQPSLLVEARCCACGWNCEVVFDTRRAVPLDPCPMCGSDSLVTK